MIDLAAQIAIRNRLVASSEVTDLVPATAILDRHSRPAPLPSIILGEAQVIDVSVIDQANRRSTVVHTIHVWQKSPSREGIKRILGAVRSALMPRLDLGADLHIVQGRVTQMRTLSDPDGETAHGVLTFEALVQEVGA